MKTAGQKAYERYMTNLAGKFKFQTMPTFSDLNAVAQEAWEAAVKSTAPIHDAYNETVTPVIEEPVVTETPVVAGV